MEGRLHGRPSRCSKICHGFADTTMLRAGRSFVAASYITLVIAAAATWCLPCSAIVDLRSTDLSVFVTGLCFAVCRYRCVQGHAALEHFGRPPTSCSAITFNMAHATGREWDVTPPDHGKSEYGFQKEDEISADAHDVQMYSDPDHKDESLHRGLKARQISMIAIGGAVGMLK